MSSAEIKAIIDDLEAKVNSLRSAIESLNCATKIYSQFPSVLQQIASGWQNSIVINGEAADKGKALERAGQFENIISTISGEIVENISTKINDYNLELAQLYVAYAAALEAERAAAEAAASGGSQGGVVAELHRI